MSLCVSLTQKELYSAGVWVVLMATLQLGRGTWSIEGCAHSHTADDTQVPKEAQKPRGVGGVGKGNVSWPEHWSIALRSGSESKYDCKSRPEPGHPGLEDGLALISRRVCT